MRNLPPAAEDARICTFGATCAESVLEGVCPHCGGNLVPRPIRPAALLARLPASGEREVKPLHRERHARLVGQARGRAQ